MIELQEELKILLKRVFFFNYTEVSWPHRSDPDLKRVLTLSRLEFAEN